MEVGAGGLPRRRRVSLGGFRRPRTRGFWGPLHRAATAASDQVSIGTGSTVTVTQAFRTSLDADDELGASLRCRTRPGRAHAPVCRWFRRCRPRWIDDAPAPQSATPSRVRPLAGPIPNEPSLAYLLPNLPTVREFWRLRQWVRSQPAAAVSFFAVAVAGGG